jgi:hypothetical protein
MGSDFVYLLDFVQAVNTLPAEQLTAAEYHDQVESILHSQGWRVWREYPVPYRSKKNGIERNGFVDLFAVRDGCRWAMELDHTRARAKSIEKLSNLDVDLRIVILRVPKPAGSRWSFSRQKGYWGIEPCEPVAERIAL